jgi:DNA polymerase-4
MAALRDTGAVVEVLGWDEAFLAVETGDPEAWARDIQDRVTAAAGLDCSVGIGQNILQAKLATGFGKPAGVFRLTHDTWFDVLGDRSTDALWGIGTKTAKKLAELGVMTVRDLADADPDLLAARFGPTTGPWLVRTGRGRASAKVVGTPWVPRSRGREITYQENLQDWADVRREVAQLARRVAAEVTAEQRLAVRVVVKVRYAPFFTATHGTALPVATVDAAEIEQAALVALGAFEPDRPVRLLGVRAELAR